MFQTSTFVRENEKVIYSFQQAKDRW